MSTSGGSILVSSASEIAIIIRSGDTFWLPTSFTCSPARLNFAQSRILMRVNSEHVPDTVSHVYTFLNAHRSHTVIQKIVAFAPFVLAADDKKPSANRLWTGSFLSVQSASAMLLRVHFRELDLGTK